MTTYMRMRAVLICIIAVAVVAEVCIAEFAVGMSVGQAGIGVSMIRQMHNHSIARHDSVVKHNCQQNNQTYGFAQHNTLNNKVFIVACCCVINKHRVALASTVLAGAMV